LITSRLRLLFALLVLVAGAPGLQAQTEASAEKPPRFEIYGGYAFVSNSPNGLPGERQPLNGWDATIAVPQWRFIRFKVDVSSYRGLNQGAKQDTYYIMGGAQFTKRFGRESAFLEGFGGDGGVNRFWGPNGAPGETASWASVLGGGLDTPISRRLAFRVTGGYQWSNFQLVNNLQLIVPIHTPGIPNNFFRLSTGLVWGF
jgi:hypothetical protein